MFSRRRFLSLMSRATFFMAFRAASTSLKSLGTHRGIRLGRMAHGCCTYTSEESSLAQSWGWNQEFQFLFCAGIRHLLLWQLLGHSLVWRHTLCSGNKSRPPLEKGKGQVIKFTYRVVNTNCWKNLQVLISFGSIKQHIHNAVFHEGLVCGAEVKQFDSNWLVSNRS